MDNVNNLNGIGNFGHGFDNEETELPVEVETPAEEPEEKVDNVEEITSEETE